MKLITDHLGQIIAVIAAISLLITSVVFFKGPIGLFFDNIIEKETSIGDKVFENLENVGMFDGEGGSGGANKPELNENGYYYNVPYVYEDPEGYVYAMVFYEDNTLLGFYDNFTPSAPNELFTDWSPVSYTFSESTITDADGCTYTFNPDGKSLVFSNDYGWAVGTTWVATGIDHGVYYNYVYISENGDTIVFLENNVILYTADGELNKISDAVLDSQGHCIWSNDYNIYASIDGEVIFLYDFNADTSTVFTRQENNQVQEDDFDLNGPTLTVNPDLSVDVNSPTIFEANSLTISGIAKDDKEIKSLSINGNNVNVNDDGSWSVTLTPTTNTVTEIKAQVKDSSNNTTTKYWYIMCVQEINYHFSAAGYDNLTGATTSKDAVVNIPTSFVSGGIPYKTVGIAAYGFQNCTNLKTVVIPNSITAITAYAFYGCSNLINVNIPNSVTEIGQSVFKDCSSLTNIDIPNSVNSIGGSAFENCSSLKSITIPEGVTIIPGSTFNRCSNLTSVTLPKSLVDININAFQSCSSLETIHIPENVTNIRSQAFYMCTNLKNINIPYGVTNIGSSAFDGCSSLTNIDIPGSVTQIKASAFESCKKLESINIPNSVTSIGDNAFYNCINLKNVRISEKITTIPNNAFAGCQNLSSITIPKSVKSIGVYAFRLCSKLSTINFDGTMSEWENVTKYTGWNSSVPATKVVCSDGEVSLGK